MEPKALSYFMRNKILSNKDFNKIFCIGFNKTGTTSLEKLLRFYGYHLPNQQEQEIRLAKQVFSTNYSELVSFVNNFNAFQDMPFSQGLTYVAVDALFPNSKFILTERDSEEWFNSYCEFTRKMFGLNVKSMTELTEQDVIDKLRYLYPNYFHEIKERLLTKFKESTNHVLWDKLFDKDYYIEMYENRNNEIKRYFSKTKNKLLIIDITKEKDTRKICSFLNIPAELAVEMPHENKS